jgi:hypothetical protein
MIWTFFNYLINFDACVDRLTENFNLLYRNFEFSVFGRENGSVTNFGLFFIERDRRVCSGPGVA